MIVTACYGIVLLCLCASINRCARMCRVFSEDGTGALGFEDFLDMLSVFSQNSDKEVKLGYIFRIYGAALSHPALLFSLSSKHRS